MRISVVGDYDTVMGFSFAGIKEKRVVNEKNVKSAMEDLMKKDDIGLIIITERMAEIVRSDIEEWREKLYPIIVEIPDKMGTIDRKDPIISLIKRTVGVDISEK